MATCMAVLGTIVKTVGLKGEVKLLPRPDFWPGALEAEELELVSDDTVRLRTGVEKFRTKGRTYILRLSGVGTIDEAETLVGLSLRVSLAGLGEAERPTDVLPCQVMGCSVILPDGSVLGTVVDMLLGDVQDCYIVENGNERYLVPNVGEVVCNVDLDRKTIEIDPPEGLLDLRW